MNYRHAFHAGNFADVHKHVGLVLTLLHLRKKETPFVVIDTHAGAGRYDLSAEEVARTGEAERGIGKLAALAPRNAAFRRYLEIVRDSGANAYPGSPLIAARLLRAQDRLIAIERHPEDFAALAAVLKPYRRARAVESDGYERLPVLLPPPERRGLVLLDPPYERADEFERLACAFAASFPRFTNGIYLLWFPMKVEAQIQKLAGELQNAGAAKILLSTINVGGADDTARLSAAGLLVVNPPFGFDTEMGAVSGEILPHLSRAADARMNVEWLSTGS